MIISYEVKGDVALLRIGMKKRACVITVRIDTEDLDRVLTKEWYPNWVEIAQAYYPAADSGRCLLHRFIMEAPKGTRVDHVNGDTLDIRKENLRFCTHSQNMMNRKTHKNNRSGVRGVHFDTRKQKWIAEVYAEGKRYKKGAATKEAAADLVIKMRKQLHKEFFSDR